MAEGEAWTVARQGTLLVVSRRDADTHGDGQVNGLDVAQLYPVALRENGAEAEPPPFLSTIGFRIDAGLCAKPAGKVRTLFKPQLVR